MPGTSETAYEIINAGGEGPAVLVCEHASNLIPARYDGLGLTEPARNSHAAWDPGAEALALRLSEALDAPLVAGRVSRLVYDCNRPPEAPGAMPERSEEIAVPGNTGLDAGARSERVATVYTPFTAAVTDTVAARNALGTPFALVTVHSFTPRWFGQRRAVEIGILHDEDARLSDAMLDEAHRIPHRRLARNEPYGPADGVTHTLKLHGLANGLQNVMIEVRNDLLSSPREVEGMAGEVMELLAPALVATGIREGTDA